MLFFKVDRFELLKAGGEVGFLLAFGFFGLLRLRFFLGFIFIFTFFFLLDLLFDFFLDHSEVSNFFIAIFAIYDGTGSIEATFG